MIITLLIVVIYIVQEKIEQQNQTERVLLLTMLSTTQKKTEVVYNSNDSSKTRQIDRTPLYLKSRPKHLEPIQVKPYPVHIPDVIGSSSTCQSNMFLAKMNSEDHKSGINKRKGSSQFYH